MGEFQKRKANESLSSALAKMGLTADLEIGSGIAPEALGPGATAPSSWGVVPVDELAPRYENPDPPHAAAAMPLEEPEKPE
jgi:hypothetical protein